MVTEMENFFFHEWPMLWLPIVWAEVVMEEGEVKTQMVGCD